MTIKTSGSLAFSEIQAEFGGSNPISLSEYYAGGAYVPAGTSGTNGAVPSSGPISVSNFYGTSNITTITLVSGEYDYGFIGDPYNEYEFAAEGYGIYGIGSISPSTIRGHTLGQFYTIRDRLFGGNASLTIAIEGITSKNFFSRVEVGGYTFYSSSAAFTYDSTYGYWNYGNIGSNYSPVNGYGTYTLVFYP
jgi:hypothetical protein